MLKTCSKSLFYACLLFSATNAQLGSLICGPTNFNQNQAEIRSPGYSRGQYPASTTCEYSISISANEEITFKFPEMDLEDDGDTGCYDKLVITFPDGTDSGDICGDSTEDMSFTNSGMAASVKVTFSSDTSEQRKGFVMEYAKTRPDPCDSEPCQNGGSCMSVMGMVRCACVPGWTGQFCAEDIDECSDEGICESNQICVNSPGSYACEAAPLEDSEAPVVQPGSSSASSGSTGNSDSSSSSGSSSSSETSSFSDFDFPETNQLFVDETTGNPCRLSDQGRNLLSMWVEEYKNWRNLMADYEVKYAQWKADECPEK